MPTDDPAAAQPQQPAAKQTAQAAVPHAVKPHVAPLIDAAAHLLRMLGRTLRVTVTEEIPFSLAPNSGTVIWCLWHNRLISCMELYRRFRLEENPDSKLAALVSASKDGAALARALANFKVHAVRGSSSRRGGQALKEMTSCLRRGYDIAITPDGPRGPKYQIHPGIITLARLSGRPIIPVGVHFHRKATLRSWDSFQVPLPFSRVDVRLEPPILIPRDLDPEAEERSRLWLESELKRVNPD